VWLLVTPTYLSSEPEHASKSYLTADIKIFSALQLIRTLNAGSMYLKSVGLNAVCLLFPHDDVFYLGHKSISGNVA